MPRRIRTYREVADPAGEDVVAQVTAQRRRLERRLSAIERVAIVASGKGGVGKSALTANLAAALAARGHSVGALDADLHGPSLARMLDARGPLAVGETAMVPARGTAGVRVVSMDLLLESDDAPVRWREPESDVSVWRDALETGALREFMADVEWGALDLLLIDAPPGTDRLDRLLALVPAPDALLLVVTPSAAATRVVARSARAAREAGIATIALVANMTRYACPRCGEAEPLWPGDGARELARRTDLPLWAEIPFEPRLAIETDAGRPPAGADSTSAAARAIVELADRLIGSSREASPARPGAGAP